MLARGMVDLFLATVILEGLPDISLGIGSDRRHQCDLWRRFDDWSGPGCARNSCRSSVIGQRGRRRRFCLGDRRGPSGKSGMGGGGAAAIMTRTKPFPTRSKKRMLVPPISYGALRRCLAQGAH
jgi:hypothetical protein